LYSSPDIIRVIELRRRTMQVGHVVHMVKMRNVTNFCLESLKGRDYSENLGTDVRTVLKWIILK
jgi:hypothetical protein